MQFLPVFFRLFRNTYIVYCMRLWTFSPHGCEDKHFQQISRSQPIKRLYWILLITYYQRHGAHILCYPLSHRFRDKLYFWHYVEFKEKKMCNVFLTVFKNIYNDTILYTEATYIHWPLSQSATCIFLHFDHYIHCSFRFLAQFASQTDRQTDGITTA